MAALGLGFLNYDREGVCAWLTLNGTRLDRVGDESEEAMRARALKMSGPYDQVVMVSWVRAGDCRPGPGFEKLAETPS
jgi:hypothetical protein